eukprot:6174935-Pleurochrysis_carterae.AAC.2
MIDAIATSNDATAMCKNTSQSQSLWTCRPGSGETDKYTNMYSPALEESTAATTKMQRASLTNLCSHGVGAISLRMPPLNFPSISKMKTKDTGSPNIWTSK